MRCPNWPRLRVGQRPRIREAAVVGERIADEDLAQAIALSNRARQSDTSGQAKHTAGAIDAPVRSRGQSQTGMTEAASRCRP